MQECVDDALSVKRTYPELIPTPIEVDDIELMCPKRPRDNDVTSSSASSASTVDPAGVAPAPSAAAGIANAVNDAVRMAAAAVEMAAFSKAARAFLEAKSETSAASSSSAESADTRFDRKGCDCEGDCECAASSPGCGCSCSCNCAHGGEEEDEKGEEESLEMEEEMCPCKKAYRSVCDCPDGFGWLRNPSPPVVKVHVEPLGEQPKPMLSPVEEEASDDPYVPATVPPTLPEEKPYSCSNCGWHAPPACACEGCLGCGIGRKRNDKLNEEDTACVCPKPETDAA